MTGRAFGAPLFASLKGRIKKAPPAFAPLDLALKESAAPPAPNGVVAVI